MRTNPVSHATGTLRAVLAAAALACAAPALAVEVFQGSTDWTGSWDTTLSYGSVWRTESGSRDIICTSNGGSSRSCNYDDGILNYSTGQVSNILRGLT